MRSAEDLEKDLELFRLYRAGLEAREKLVSAEGAPEPPAASERELAVMLRAGEDAGNEIAHRYLRLAEIRARDVHRLLSPSIPFDDLLSAAHEGLTLAIQRFDPDRGVPFRSYAWQPIFWHIWDEALKLKPRMQLSRHAQRKISRILRTEKALRDELVREPTLAEMAERTGLAVKDVQLLLQHARQDGSGDVAGDEAEDAPEETSRPALPDAGPLQPAHLPRALQAFEEIYRRLAEASPELSAGARSQIVAWPRALADDFLESDEVRAPSPLLRRNLQCCAARLGAAAEKLLPAERILASPLEDPEDHQAPLFRRAWWRRLTALGTG